MEEYCKIVKKNVEMHRMLSSMCDQDVSLRAHSLDSLLQFLSSELEPSKATDADADEISDRTKQILHNMRPHLLRLIATCPHKNVREMCDAILKMVLEQDKDYNILRLFSSGPCRFIPASEVIPVSTEDKDTQMVFINAFMQNSRLEHVHQVMGYHPRYLEAFVRSQNYILADGPLLRHCRHYIAIMAAARHQCMYLVKLHMHEFIMHGGDPQWLCGLDHAPPKLRNLSMLNKILAHRPWLVKKEHIRVLRKGSNNNDMWSLSELMHAMVIMIHFHSLCSFVGGCGVTLELDQRVRSSLPDLSSGEESEDNSSDSSCMGERNINVDDTSLDCLMSKMKQLAESGLNSQATEEERREMFQLVESQNSDMSVHTKSRSSGGKDVSRFVVDNDFAYCDFHKTDPVLGISTFRFQDFSWQDHGFSLANRLYPDIGIYLDDRFVRIFNLTYYMMGSNPGVDTTNFRQAIWYYIQCLFGIRHDDYNYIQINQLLSRELKHYIKTATCYPDRVEEKDYDSAMKSFKHSEKVHINLMIMEARMQAELMYMLRAVSQFMT